MGRDDRKTRKWMVVVLRRSNFAARKAFDSNSGVRRKLRLALNLTVLAGLRNDVQATRVAYSNGST